MSQLTKRQNEIYNFLQQHIQESGHAPSIDEVCHAMGVKSRGSMHKHIQALVNAGLIEPFNGQKRGIRLKNSSSEVEEELITLPLLGKIAAGVPFEALENPETISLPSSLVPHSDCYMLTIKGDSMINAGIHDGDWVVIEKTSVARNGDIVVALIDNYEATLKRFEKTDDLVILHPENSLMKAMIFNPQRVTIQGKLVAQLRKYW